MNSVALITGGSRGIGLGIATELAKNGIDLAILGRRASEKVTKVMDELKQNGADILYIQGNIASEKDRQNLLRTVKNHFGKLNFLINNAGIAPRVRNDILQATEENFDEVMDVNLKGPYFLTQQVAKWMIEQKQKMGKYEACIINISSVSATVASTNRGEYCISKAGMHMMTQLFAVRLGEYDIPVYEIRPGIILTDMTVKVREKYDKLIREGVTIQNRWGMPEDVGKVALALVKGNFGYSTGQVISVDGGMTLQKL